MHIDVILGTLGIDSESETGDPMRSYEDALAIAELVAKSDEYSNSYIPDNVIVPNNFCEEVHVPNMTRSKINSFLTGYESVDQLLDTSWKAAKESGAIRHYEEKVLFPIDAMGSDGETPLEVSFKIGDPERSCGKSWFVNYLNTYSKAMQSRYSIPAKAIEEFAWMGPWDTFLSNLADITLDERWDFNNNVEEGRRFEILKSYICHTYYRLDSEGKICISDDKSFAAFNTGLVDKRFDDIILCFEPQNGQPEWRFVGFAASGNRKLKKKVASHFSPLPQTAQYFDKIEDLLFDPSHDLIVDYEHILIDNVDRLPLDFLAEELRNCDEACAAIDEIRKPSPDDDVNSLYETLSEIIETDSRVFRMLRSRMEDAVDIAKRRVKWNFKTAIPSYYPRANSMSLLLPLCLLDEQIADVALVVQLQKESMNYTGQTILTIKQAYTNARLICRPDSDWLTTAR